MHRAQIDNDRDSVGGSGIPEVTFRPLPFAEHRPFVKRSHVKDRKGFDMTYFGSTRVVDQACSHSLPLAERQRWQVKLAKDAPYEGPPFLVGATSKLRSSSICRAKSRAIAFNTSIA